MPGKKPISHKPINQNADKKAAKVAKSKLIKKDTGLFERINNYLSRNINWVFWIVFTFTLLFGILLFDIRVSTSGDDSTYIVRAFDFIHHSIYPSFQGPLYPIILGLFISVSGIKLIPLKIVSLIFILLFIWFTWKAFKERIPAILLAAVLILVSINSYILYYASQTYSEALFMFLQAFMFFLFFRLFVIEKDINKTISVRFRQSLFLAFLVICLGFTRLIGFAAVFAIALFFILKSQWKNLLIFTAVFTCLLVVVQTFIFIAWGNTGISFPDLVQSLLLKDYYNPAYGKENLSGFISRFADNSNLYLSNYFYTLLGLHKADNLFVSYPFVTLLSCLMLIASVIVAFRKNDGLFFTGIYIIIFLSITFLIAHPFWRQIRFIIPYFLLILMMFLYFLYYVLNLKPFKSLQFIFPVVVLLLVYLTLKATIPQIREVRQVVNKYSGMTPDWRNYCKISEWTSGNLPSDAVIACRKPAISFIYSKGKPFYGIMRMPFYSADSLLLNWQNNHLPYYLIPTWATRKTMVSKELLNEFKTCLVGFGINNAGGTFETKFFIMDFPDSTKGKTLAELQKFQIECTGNLDSLKKYINNPAYQISIIYPDSLLGLLMKAKATHVITANLRAIPEQKDGRTINTVERYLGFIEFKYPDIKTKLIQIGDDTDEPASIYRLNYLH